MKSVPNIDYLMLKIAIRALTNRQKQILDFIKRFIETNQYPPTRQEIMREFDIVGYFAVHNHLHILENKGYIKIIPNIARGIILTGKPYEVESPRGEMPPELPELGGGLETV